MRLLTAEDVAAILQLALPRVYELARSGKIPVVRVGRQVRFDEAALRRWIEAGGCPLDDGQHQQ